MNIHAYLYIILDDEKRFYDIDTYVPLPKDVAMVIRVLVAVVAKGQSIGAHSMSQIEPEIKFWD